MTESKSISPENSVADINRRQFLVFCAAGTFIGTRLFGAATPGGKPVVRCGMVTDLHYADINPDRKQCGVVGRRYYRESLRKLTEAVNVFNARGVDFAIELGDFKDLTKGRAETLSHLESIEAALAKFNGPRYHVAGNHDFDCLTPDEFFSRIPNDGKVCTKGYYSFVRGGVTFIVLNACFDSTLKPYNRSNPWNDANVPPDEMTWLERELASAPGPVIVFCHQRLDDSAEPRHIVKNAAAVRALFEKSGKVKGVITGHQHLGGMNVVNGITYYSLRALVCGTGEGQNSFAEMAVYADGTFTITGWRNAVSHGAKGEFPMHGIVAHRGDAADFPGNTLSALNSAVAKGAEMIDIDEGRCKNGELFLPTLAEALKGFPKKGIYLNIHCKSGSAAPEVAELLRKSGRLAQCILMLDSRSDLVAVRTTYPWVLAGLVVRSDAGSEKPWTEEEAWSKLRDAVSLGVSFVQIPQNCHCTPDQMRFLHDHAVRTTYFLANDPKTMKALIAEGHDFIFTDFYSKLRPVYDTSRPA